MTLSIKVRRTLPLAARRSLGIEVTGEILDDGIGIEWRAVAGKTTPSRSQTVIRDQRRRSSIRWQGPASSQVGTARDQPFITSGRGKAEV